MNATFTKLRTGAWGLRVVGSPSAGDEVTVTKRNGTIETVNVGRVLWSGQGAAICTIERSQPRAVVGMAVSGPARPYAARRGYIGRPAVERGNDGGFGRDAMRNDVDDSHTDLNDTREADAARALVYAQIDADEEGTGTELVF